MTIRMSKMSVGNKQIKTGPPVSWEFGWDIRNSKHRRELLLLYENYTPSILWFATTCGPWSNSNTTMALDDLLQVREQEMGGIEFMVDMCKRQSRRDYDYVLEQPQASELLKLAPVLSILDLPTSVPDQPGCHCRHGLRDPDNGLLCMKPFVLRGSILFPRACVWCKGDHPHQVLQGTLKNGVARTKNAQQYTKQFCTAASKDMAVHKGLTAKQSI